jgi:glycosyltransferase involved in cell wall biosynthesis
MESLKSSLKQTYPNIEVIVCFDPDETGFKEILDKYDSRLKHCALKGFGTSTTLNQALTLVTGDFIAHLDEGDVFTSNKVIELLVDIFRRNPGVGFVFTAYQVVAEDGSIRSTF